MLIMLKEARARRKAARLERRTLIRSDRKKAVIGIYSTISANVYLILIAVGLYIITVLSGLGAYAPVLVFAGCIARLAWILWKLETGNIEND